MGNSYPSAQGHDLSNQIAQLQVALEQQAELIRQLQQQNAYLTSNTTASLPMDKRRPKEKLPTLDKYGGKRQEWDEWHLAATNKLMVDGEAIGTALDQFMYLFSRLTGDAARAVSTKAQTLSTNKTGNGSEFLIYLDTIYGDPNKRSRALQQLYSMKQKEQESFATFLPKFETVLTNAGWADYGDEQKISLLKNALNKEMRLQTVNLIGTSMLSWASYVSHLQTVSSELAGIQQASRKQYIHFGNQRTESSEMDWEPTKSNTISNPAKTTNRKRATWVTKEAIAVRREKGLCLRCGRPGHMLNNCNLLPATRPNSAKVYNISTTKEILKAAMAEGYEEEDKDNEEQGKE